MEVIYVNAAGRGGARQGVAEKGAAWLGKARLGYFIFCGSD